MSAVRMTWSRRFREDAAHEFRSLAEAARRSRTWWLIKSRTSWRIEGWLLAWVEGVEPSNEYEGRFLAEDDNGDFLVPDGVRDGEPWWQGYWRWWRPDHWPVYIRSRRARAYVMVETYGSER